MSYSRYRYRGSFDTISDFTSQYRTYDGDFILVHGDGYWVNRCGAFARMDVPMRAMCEE